MVKDISPEDSSKLATSDLGQRIISLFPLVELLSPSASTLEADIVKRGMSRRIQPRATVFFIVLTHRGHKGRPNSGK